ncbi:MULTISPECIES: ubiquinone anaerobic biosynthesis accessory factor UbiT [Rhizobium]|uniref:Putative lipid carrier protein YhbT n=1 Tax=Rhizobium paranaense TaxID=1650438 RepID=A0A7W8XXW1_9HYPH|nr:SCP2 sterol-binding domain-containing protein [Rhizobium paranaense]MBB5577589.1 putative lipid carrier protein YhbT [Rhizobium paranaense]
MLAPPSLMATARIVPLPIAARIADLLLQQVLRNHPKLFDRLGEYGNARFAFVPTDFAFSFCIRPLDRSVRTVRKGNVPQAEATITGPLALMLALAEGRVDGDALFFARKLLISGDMEAVLALRNALDDNEIDLVRSLSKLAGPMSHSAGKILDAIRRGALEVQGVQWN